MGKYLKIVLTNKKSNTQDSRVQDEINELTKKGYSDENITSGETVDNINPQTRFKSLFNALVFHLQGKNYNPENFVTLQELLFVMDEAWETNNYDNFKLAIDKMVAVPERPLWQRADGSCRVCNSRDYWVSVHCVTVCLRCHPPANDKLVTRWGHA